MKYLPFALAPLALAMSFAAQAADDKKPLDEIVITASRSAQTAGVDTAYIQVITSEDIQSSGAQTVTDVLRRAAVIQTVDTSGNGSSPVIGMRGFGSNGSQNVLVLLDGRRFNNDTDIGTVNLRNLSLIDIERIEIVNGSSGALFGAGAVGGVINIITKSATKNQLDVSISRGNYDTEKYRARGSARKGSWSVVVNGDKETSDNYRDNNELNSAFGQVRLAFEGQRFDSYVEVSKLNQNANLPGALDKNEVAQNRRQARPANANDFSNFDSTRVSVGGRLKLTDDWTFSIDSSQRQDDFKNFLGAPFTQTRDQLTLSPKVVGSLSFLNAKHRIIAGQDIENGRYNISSALGSSTGKPTTNSSYLQITSPVSDRINVVTGYRYGRHHHNISSAPKVKDSVGAGSIGVFWAAADNTKVWARADQNFRFAAIDEHTSSASGQPLKTQTGESYELGIEHRYNQHVFNLQAYQLDLKNEIGFQPVLGFFCCNINFDPTRRQGLSASWNSSVTQQLDTSLQLGLVDAKFSSGGFSGKRIPHVPKTALTGAVTYRPLEKTTVGLESQFTGRKVADGDFDNDQRRAKAVFVHNLAITQGWKDVTVSLRINNLLDKKYNLYTVEEALFPPPTFAFTGTDLAFYPAAERNALLTLAYSLK
ncbi:MAG: TonB-dependent receptor [Pseudomonadota bacterium]